MKAKFSTKNDKYIIVAENECETNLIQFLFDRKEIRTGYQLVHLDEKFKNNPVTRKLMEAFPNAKLILFMKGGLT